MKVVQTDDRVEIFDDDGKSVLTCEAYELDFIVRALGAEYEEGEEV